MCISPPKVYFLLAFITFMGYGCTQKQERSERKISNYIQMRISGTDVQNVACWVRAKSDYHRVGMFLKSFGGPSRDMVFRGQNSFKFTFPVGKEVVLGKFDTTSIGPNERLVFDIKMAKQPHKARINEHTSNANLRVELLANGQVVQAIQIPNSTQDSTAILSFDTNRIYSSH